MHIGACIAREAFDLFGGHVVGRAQLLARHREPLALFSDVDREPEVE
jgi:hypothetical protein